MHESHASSLAILDLCLLPALLGEFDLKPGPLRPDLTMPGSPERCLARQLVQDSDGGLWVLEHLFGGQRPRREGVARVLRALKMAGLSGIPAYREVRGGGFAAVRQDGSWQLAPFFPGDVLPRPAYIEDAQRGASLARFLIALRDASSLALTKDAPAARLPAYVDELLGIVGRTRPELLPTLAPVRTGLEGLFAEWQALPRALCHGDFHPLNVIWNGQEAAAVIDWEFTGPGPELYDAANMLGCVGSEDPRALGRGLCAAFVTGLRAGGLLRKDNQHWLYPLTLALRFAWLSEWLRKDDGEMIAMETAYMRLILNSRQTLERAWGIG